MSKITQYSIGVIAISLIAIGVIYVLTEPQLVASTTVNQVRQAAPEAKPSVAQAAKEPTKPAEPPKTVQVDIPIDAYIAPQGWKGEKVFTDNYYVPNKVEVRVGDTVVWTNKDLITHTVTFYKGITVDSGPFEQGKTWKYTFTKAGEFEYFCTLHPYMAGKVEVEP